MSQDWDLSLYTYTQATATADVVAAVRTQATAATADTVVTTKAAASITVDAQIAVSSQDQWPISLIGLSISADTVVLDRTVSRTFTADTSVAAYTFYDVTAPPAVTLTTDVSIIAATATQFTKTVTADTRLAAPGIIKTLTTDAVVSTAAPAPSNRITLNTAVNITTDPASSASLLADPTTVALISETATL